MINLKMYLYAVVVLFLAGTAATCVHYKSAYEHLQLSQATGEKDAADAAVAALQASMARTVADEKAKTDQAKQAAQQAQEAAEAASAKASQWAAAYRKALKEDASCAAWASQAIACPL